MYDAFFPPQFTFICNPERPAVCGRFGLRRDQLWRFEFVVKKDEDGYEMAKYENVQKVIFPYLTHPKEKYGLGQDLIFPESCIEVIRSRPFTFSARSCNKWALGRVILCGDAAHVFPPCKSFPCLLTPSQQQRQLITSPSQSAVKASPPDSATPSPSPGASSSPPAPPPLLTIPQHHHHHTPPYSTLGPPNANNNSSAPSQRQS